MSGGVTAYLKVHRAQINRDGGVYPPQADKFSNSAGRRVVFRNDKIKHYGLGFKEKKEC
jgi:hypothetical protein